MYYLYSTISIIVSSGRASLALPAFTYPASTVDHPTRGCSKPSFLRLRRAFVLFALSFVASFCQFEAAQIEERSTLCKGWQVA